MRSWPAYLLLAAGCTGHNPAYVVAEPGPVPAEAGMEAAPVDAGAEEFGTVPPPDVPVEAPGYDELESGAVEADAPSSEAPSGDAPSGEAASPPDLQSDVATMPPGCGDEIADIAGIANAEGVVADTDGTLYVLTHDRDHSYVGRVPRNGKPDVKWLELSYSPTPRGLALDGANQRLYALLTDGAGGLVKFEHIKDTPNGSEAVTSVNGGNDVAVGPDGTVYYTQQSDRHVYRVPVSGGLPKAVTSSPLGSATTNQAPAALAFAPNGNLLVGLARSGPVYELTLEAGQEMKRAPFGTWTGWANGMTFDRRGRLYISVADGNGGAVVRLEADGGATPILIGTGGHFSSLAFGRGPLDCRDLYVAHPTGPLQRIRVPDSF